MSSPLSSFTLMTLLGVSPEVAVFLSSSDPWMLFQVLTTNVLNSIIFGAYSNGLHNFSLNGVSAESDWSLRHVFAASCFFRWDFLAFTHKSVCRGHRWTPAHSVRYYVNSEWSRYEWLSWVCRWQHCLKKLQCLITKVFSLYSNLWQKEKL